MNLAKYIPDWIEDHLPQDGTLGALRRKKPTLYTLTLITGASAFTGIIFTLFYTLALLPLVGARAIVAVTNNDPILAWAWTLLLAGVGVLFVGVVVVVGRWVGEFAVIEE